MIFYANTNSRAVAHGAKMGALARSAAAAIACAAMASATQAAFNVKVGAAPSSGGAWNDLGATKIWTPSAAGANVNVTEIQTRLAAAPVQISTGGVGSPGLEEGDLSVNSPVDWSVKSLELFAARNIVFNANLNGTGTPVSGAQLLRLRYAQVSAAAGDLIYSPEVKINLAAGPSVFYAQTGTSSKTYKVITALGNEGSLTGSDLQGMNATIGNSTAYYALGADIAAAATSGWASGAGFSPLGGGVFFSGDLHGLNHNISGLTINRPALENVGLFDTVRGEVRDLHIVGGSVIGLGFVGSLAGSSEGRVYRVSSSASVINKQIPGTYPSALGGLVGFVNGESITASYATGDVTASNGGDHVGGLVGFNRNTIAQSYATGYVVGGAGTGGLVGQQQSGLISNVYATGNVTGTDYVGGVLGFNDATVANSFSTGVVTATGSSVGGVVGFNRSTVSNSYWNRAVSTQSSGGAGTGTIPLTTAQMQQTASFAGFDFATNSSPWRMYEGHSLPLIRALLIPLTITADNAAAIYDGTTIAPILLTNASFNPAYAATAPSIALIFGLTAPYGATPYQPGARLPDLWSTQMGFDISTSNAQLTVSTPARPLDIDDSFATGTSYHALTDGVLVIRGMLGLAGNALVAGVRGPGAVRDAAAIAQRLTLLNRALDIDDNGSLDPATDGVLVMRYLLGFRGSALVGTAVGACPSGRICRTGAAAIEAYLLSLIP